MFLVVDLRYPLRAGFQSPIYAPTVDPESYEGGGDTCKGMIFVNLVAPALRTVHILNIVSRHDAEGPEEGACRAL